MKKFMNPRTYGALIASIALVSVLSACGGGGGGGEAPVVTPPPVVDKTPPVLTLSNTSPAALTTPVVVTSNKALGGSVAITVQAPTGATVTGSTVPNRDNMGMTWSSLSGPLTCNTVYKVTASATDLAGNVGTLSNGTVTTVACPALRYTDKVVAAWTYGYLYMVTKTSVTPAVNKTSYQGGAIPLGSCGLLDKAQADGSVLAECTAVDLKRHVLKLDPTTGILTDFNGTVPVGATFVLAESNSVKPVANTTSAHVADGWFYADPNARWKLLFQPDGGSAPSVVKDGNFTTDGTANVLRAYSN